MTKLSINVNKVATLRNARLGNDPDVRRAAEICLDAGAAGITVHPRPDGRHIRYADVHRLGDLCSRFSSVEFNIEGYPTPDFLSLVLDCRPDQCTLVPDAPEALTSDHGWDVLSRAEELAELVASLHAAHIRVSLFLDANAEQVTAAAATGTDRIELYTEPYARAFGTKSQSSVLADYIRAAEEAHENGLGVNAGHDLNLANLESFCDAVPSLLEVSIGHALISHAFEVGLSRAVRDYLTVLDHPSRVA